MPLFEIFIVCVAIFSTQCSSPDSLNGTFIVLSLLMSVHDNGGHYEEANVSQENQNDWSNERPNERCCRIQIAAAEIIMKEGVHCKDYMLVASNILRKVLKN